MTISELRTWLRDQITHCEKEERVVEAHQDSDRITREACRRAIYKWQVRSATFRGVLTKLGASDV